MPHVENVSLDGLFSVTVPGPENRPPRRRKWLVPLMIAVAAAAIAAVAAGAAGVHRLTSGDAPVLRVDGSPGGLAVSPDGRTLYLADSSADAITPVSAATGKPGRPIPVAGGSPGSSQNCDLAITPDGRTLFTAVYNQSADGPLPLARVDLRTGRETGQVQVPGGAVLFVMSRDGATLYVASGDNALYAVSTATGRRERQIPVPGRLLDGPAAMALSPDGATLYLAASSDGVTGTVTPVNLRTGRPGRTLGWTGVPQSLAITPDGRTLYAAVDGFAPVLGQALPSHLEVIDTATDRVRASLPWQAPLQYLQMTPTGKTVWVVSTLQGTGHAPNNTVTPVTVAGDRPGQPLRTSGLLIGQHSDSPTGVALSPDGRALYVTVPSGLETFRLP